jgi:uncharacterized protein
MPAQETPQPWWLRWSLITIGLLALILGAIGVVIPGLPTTPFVLLAAACFVRASPALYNWLIRNRWLGPMILDWQQHRSITRRTKVVALLTMFVTISFSLWALQQRPYIQIAVLIAALIGFWSVMRLPVRAPEGPSTPER